MKYNFWATLLTDFKSYQTEEGFEMNDGSKFLFCDELKLIDKLNRVPIEVTPETRELMEKGKALEICLHSDVYSAKSPDHPTIFQFDPKYIDPMRKEVSGGLWQTFVETTIPVDDNQVRVYGYSDVIRRNRNIDVKSTKSYSWPKFEKAYQHKVYLLAANDMGYKLDDHRYLITDFTDYYFEDYIFDREEYLHSLQIISRDLIAFIEAKRGLITNPKLFL